IYVIPGLHSLQYWYFVYLLKKNEAADEHLQGNSSQTSAWSRISLILGPMWGRLSLFFATAVGLAWLGFSGIPEFLDTYLVAHNAKLGENPEVSSITIGMTPFVA